MNQVAFITGSSSGIGLATSVYLARRGCTVWATMRNTGTAEELQKIVQSEKLPIEITQLDVRDDTSVRNAIEGALQKSGRIDVLINNAGYGLRGAVEEVSLFEWQAQFETNFFGAIRVTQAVLPHMRQHGSGTIVNISSVLGRMALPFSGAYVASKFALEGLSETLRYELGAWGIRVILIEPGFIATNFQNNAQMPQATKYQDSPYSRFKEAVARRVQLRIHQAAPPEAVAAVICKAITHKRPKLRYGVGRDARLVLPSLRFLPSRFFESILKQQLGLP